MMRSLGIQEQNPAFGLDPVKDTGPDRAFPQDLHHHCANPPQTQHWAADTPHTVSSLSQVP